MGFNALSKSAVMSIAASLLKSFIEVAASKGIKVFIGRSFLKRLLLSGYKKNFGARPLRRAVEKIMLDQLSEKLLTNELTAGNTISFTSDASGRVVLHRSFQDIN